MYDSMKDKQIGIADVIEKWGVPPEKMIDLQAMTGDSVDNVPGIPGIGPKTAATAAGRIWRPRHAARARHRDQAGEAPADDHRERRQGAAVARAGEAPDRRAARHRRREPGAGGAGRAEADRLPEDDAIHHADAPRADACDCDANAIDPVDVPVEWGASAHGPDLDAAKPAPVPVARRDRRRCGCRAAKANGAATPRAASRRPILRRAPRPSPPCPSITPTT
jgi:DNA polymerase-1